MTAKDAILPCGGSAGAEEEGCGVKRGQQVHEWRQHTREQCSGAVDLQITVLESGRLERVQCRGAMVDISCGGVGIVTDHLLEPGFVRLTGIAGQESGMVVWARPSGGLQWRVGIQFMHAFAKLMRKNGEHERCEEMMSYFECSEAESGPRGRGRDR